MLIYLKILVKILKIGIRIIFSLTLIIIAFIGGVLINLNIIRAELIENTAENAITFASDISDRLDHRMQESMIMLEIIAVDPEVKSLVKESNLEFEKIEDVDKFLAENEIEWDSNIESDISLFNKIENNPLSQRLEDLRQILHKSSGIDIFPEILVVNKYGATIAENIKTVDWDQSHKLQFQNTKNQGWHLSDLYYDKSAEVWGLEVALDIRNDDNFSGMVKTVYNIEDIIEMLHSAREAAPYNDYRIFVFTGDNRYIYADDPNLYTLGGNADQIFVDYELQTEKEGFHIVNVLGANRLMSWTTSDGFKDNPGLGWTVAISIPEQEFLGEINEIQNILIGVLLISIGIAITISVYMIRKVVGPIIKVKDASNEISQGNFDVCTAIKSNDEIGQLSSSFDLMAKKLQEAQKDINLREELIKQQEDILLKFSDSTQDCSVVVIDIMGSTKTTAKLTDDQTSHFYGIFINTTAKIIKKFNGITIKNLGDGILFYFPKTNAPIEEELQNTLQCCFDICGAHDEINKEMEQENLPNIDFRISITYGTVRIARVATSMVEDIFGSTVNRCSKINHLAKANSVVVGENFYEKAKNLVQYTFQHLEDHPSVKQYNYSVYSVSNK